MNTSVKADIKVIKPPKSANETQRQKALEDYKILDTESEVIFDEITKTAAKVCDAEIALVSLIDNDRQWFKSKHGLDVNETPRDVSYCGHAILQDEIFVVEDSEQDERFSDNPFFLNPPHVRFYAGAPLKTPEGYNVGTLCVIDPKKKQLSETQKSTLRSLAKLVVSYFEIRKKNERLHTLSQEVEAQNTKNETLLQNLAEGYVVHDPEGKIIEYNDAALEILSLTENQLLGKDSFDPMWKTIKEDGSLFPPEEHPASITLTTGKPVRGVTMGVSEPKDGLKWIRINSSPISNESGRCVLVTFLDITQIKSHELEMRETLEKLRFFEAVMENSSDFIGIADVSNVPIYCNPHGRDMIGIPRDVDIGTVNIAECYPEDLRDTVVKDIFEGLQTKGIWRGETYFQHFDTKERIPVSDTHFMVKDLNSGKILGHATITRDIREEKALREDLFEQQKIAEQSARLASIGEMAAGIGHEINNPLTIVLSNFSRISRALKKANVEDEKIERLIQQQQEACIRIKKIVAGMRGLANFTGETDDSESDLGESLENTVSLAKALYQKEEINIEMPEMEGEIPIIGSATYVQQIILNLLTNAHDSMKDRDNQKIVLSIEELEDYWRLQVKDWGTGISSESASKVFDAFFTTKEVGKGTGLGLSLTKKMLESFGGHIDFESSNKGTTFFVDFPKPKSGKVARTQRLLRSHDSSAKLKVLVVDDEEVTAECLSEMLTDLDCQVVVAATAHDALEMLKKSQDFDVIISDIKIPVMDGLTLLTEVSQMGLDTGLFKVIATGGIAKELSSSNSDFRLGQIDGFIHKPFNEEEIRGVIEKARNQLRKFKKSA